VHVSRRVQSLGILVKPKPTPDINGDEEGPSSSSFRDEAAAGGAAGRWAGVARGPSRAASLLGDHLALLDAEGGLSIWDASDAALARIGASSGGQPGPSESSRPLAVFPAPPGFDALCFCHPPTWVNKLVVGARDGRVAVWNFHTNRVVHVFAPLSEGWSTSAGRGGPTMSSPSSGSGPWSVRALEPSPALDVVAVSLGSGDVHLRNLRLDADVRGGTVAMLRGAAGAAAAQDRGGVASAARALEGPATALAFFGGGAGGQDEPAPLLATAGAAGIVTIWDLGGDADVDPTDETAPRGPRFRCALPMAHSGAVLRAAFLPGEPVLVTAGADNALRCWLFEGNTGQAPPRLLRHRSGHAAPPLIVRHHGSSGLHLLSCGRDRAFRMFNAVRDQQSLELSQGGARSSKRARKLRTEDLDLKLPPVTSLDSCEQRERDWDSCVTCHAGDTRAYTWRLDKGTLGEWVLQPPRSRHDATRDGEATACCLSRCGNFALVGSAHGRVDRYNVQSGAWRGALERPLAHDAGAAVVLDHGAQRRSAATRAAASGIRSFVAEPDRVDETDRRRPAHDGRVTGVVVCAASQRAVTCGDDGALRGWNLATGQVDASWTAPPADRGPGGTAPRLSSLVIHRPGGLVAAALSPPAGLTSAAYEVRIWDALSLRVARRFGGVVGHQDRVTDLSFSPCGRRLVSSSLDGTVRVWDVPAGALLQACALGPVVTSLSWAPAGGLLATAHAGRRGVHLWADATAEMVATASIRGATVGSARPVPCWLPAVPALGEGGWDARSEARKRGTGGSGGDESPGGAVEGDWADNDGSSVSDDDGDGFGDWASDGDGGGAGDDNDVVALPTPAPPPVPGGGPAPLAPELVTTSGLPRARWLGLVDLAAVRARNKPIDPPKKPAQAPFFLFSRPGGDENTMGRQPTFAAGAPLVDAPTETDDDDSDAPTDGRPLRERTGKKRGNEPAATRSRIGRADAVTLGGGGLAAPGTDPLADALRHGGRTGDWSVATAAIRAARVPALDAFVRALEVIVDSDKSDNDALDGDRPSSPTPPPLGPGEEGVGLLLEFLAADLASPTAGGSFDTSNAVLAVTLEAHGAEVRQSRALRARAEAVRLALQAAWGRVGSLLDEVTCAASFVSNLV